MKFILYRLRLLGLLCYFVFPIVIIKSRIMSEDNSRGIVSIAVINGGIALVLWFVGSDYRQLKGNTMRRKRYSSVIVGGILIALLAIPAYKINNDYYHVYILRDIRISTIESKVKSVHGSIVSGAIYQEIELNEKVGCLSGFYMGGLIKPGGIYRISYLPKSRTIVSATCVDCILP